MPGFWNPGESNDPFLTHTQAIARPNSAHDGSPDPIPDPALQAPVPNPSSNTTSNPFMTHSGQGQQAMTADTNLAANPFSANPNALPPDLNVAVDPFLTHCGVVTGDAPENIWDYAHMKQELKDIRKAILGQGDPDREKGTLQQMALLSWLIFTWVLLLWLLMRHYSYKTTVVLTWFLVAGCFWLILAWLSGRSSRRAPIGALGILGILAICGAVECGQLGWASVWRQYWWTQTGYVYEGNTAETPAGARLDASVVGFVGEDGQRLAGTTVDVFRSAGYKDGHTYCVAPVLNQEAVANGLARVNYWAVGIDCCESLGSFTCDETRSGAAGYGVVMLGAGYPCPECNVEQFQKAITKAEAMYGFVSGFGALNVRWVQNPGTVQWQFAWRAIFYIIICIILANPVCLVCAYVLWYKGIGKGRAPNTKYVGGPPPAYNDVFSRAAELRAKVTGRRQGQELSDVTAA